MNLNIITRMLKEVSPNILWKLFRNMCVSSAVNLHKFNKRIKRGEKFFPAFVFISLTNKCDLHCKGCWVSKTNPAQELSFKQLDNIIQISKKNGSKFFGLLGGEPLMYDNLFKIIEKHSDCYFQLFTNGSFLTNDTAKKLSKSGNVTPLISIEGFEKESNERRSQTKPVFQNAVTAVKNCSENKLFTGVASSICKSNFKELVSKEYLSFLIKNKVQYLWYYIYRPVGAEPSPELALDQNEIIALRKFIVDMRVEVPLIIVDAYWDADGNALCPGAVGLSHHISPNGAVEFCPPFQFACDFLNETGGNLEAIFNNSIS